MVHPASSGGTTTTTTTPGTTTSTGATSLTISYINKSIGLDKTSKSQLNALAATIKQGGLRSVTVNSYVNKGGTVRSSNILSKHEASNVASYLKSRLAALHVSGVSFRVVGHGATSFIATPTSLNNRRTAVVAKR
ncbi:MAG: OmpA family protein [Acidimicrobiales bacterium]